MKKRLWQLGFFVSMLLGAASSSWAEGCDNEFCLAAPAVTGGGDLTRISTRWYMGLAWELGGKQGMLPDFVVGVRSMSVKSDDSVTGGDANLRFKLKDSAVSFDSIRLAYLQGKRDFIAGAGLGYSLTSASPIASLTAQASYLRLGADYAFMPDQFRYFAEINTLERPEKVAKAPSSLECSLGTLASTDLLNQLDPYQKLLGQHPSEIVNGSSCAYSVHDKP